MEIKINVLSCLGRGQCFISLNISILFFQDISSSLLMPFIPFLKDKATVLLCGNNILRYYNKIVWGYEAAPEVLSCNSGCR